MATIHDTTMTPTKLELLTEWLPQQPWYEGEGSPDLVKSGGFRLDDPEGEVGIEIQVAVDTAGPEPVAYLVPMGYRGAPLQDAPAGALIGTSEHGVLGPRWIYDGAHDPVVMAQLRALLRGEAEAQHQSESDTPTRPSSWAATAAGPRSDSIASCDKGELSADFRLRRRRVGPAGRNGPARVFATFALQ
ncbi:hypothetical protein GCM10029992_47480 [Glycomyces albus]